MQRIPVPAYSDATGQWINFYTGKKLTDFVKVIW
jgi:hypothetical protein